jgi:hypothetical protein
MIVVEQAHDGGFLQRTISQSVTADTVAMRRGWPIRQPSPKKSPLSRIAMTASLPSRERTVIFTLPSSI